MQSVLKVPGGKVVKIKVEGDSTISSIQILGDFFMHPEDALEHIEAALVGCSKTQSAIEEKIGEVLKAKQIEILGAAPEHIAQAIMEAK